MKNKDAKDPVVSQYMSAAQTFLKRGIETGKIADVSDAAINAKMELAIDEMKEDTNTNCVNISVLFKKHAKQCKSTRTAPQHLRISSKRWVYSNRWGKFRKARPLSSKKPVLNLLRRTVVGDLG
ncbi:MAG: hypothetical protein H0V72_19100 [Bradyrhizobium sp.]|nr:hypothetical protein [Bradyrhizobium sp.]